MGRVRTPTAHKRIVLSDRGQHRRSLRGIRANAVAPGFIDTDMPRFRKTEEGRATVIGIQALQRIAEPEDAASVIAFLASDEARWITGDSIRVDGGSKL